MNKKTHTLREYLSHTLKRTVDILGATLGLTLFSPLLIVVALLIKKESPGPVFYKGVRAGKKRAPFKMFKFRSMVMNADKIGGPSTRGGDPRLTKIGAFIRRYKIDELPQLINVLKGDMSLVGPRPEVPHYAELYKGDEEKVYEVRPGMTDYASLWDIHEEDILAKAKSSEEAEEIYLTEVRPTKVKLQLKYVHEKGLLTDLKIIGKTIGKLIFS